MTASTPRHQKPTGLTRFLFGAPYYPEHWSPADRADDARRMAEAGVNVVRMAEFAWDLIEPRRGQLNFALFDETIARLGEVGIGTILCTPTATPPRWLTADHEDWLRVAEDGRRMEHGSRQHCCTAHEGFRAESRRITAAMAEHFAGNPHVVGWQTDNELNCHFSLCYCPACQAGFRQWLKARYASIEDLNRCWGTAFWALTFDRFDHVPLPYPKGRPAYANPSHLRDYYRFTSDAVIEFQRQQVEILREANPRWWVTHNGLYANIDYWKFTEDLDFLGVDVYPGYTEHADPLGLQPATKYEVTRASSGGFIVPELQGGPGAQGDYQHANLPPGRMRLWAYQSIAHGADGVMHFRWRSCRFGAEEYWCGILDHDNVPRRRYAEFSQEGAELKRIGPRLLNTVLEVKAAALIEQDQDVAHGALSLGLPSPFVQAQQAYAEMWRRRLPCGLVDAHDSYEGLELLVVPSMLMMDEDLAGRLGRFVEGGGVLLVTARTATKDRNNHVIAQTPPGLLAELCGVKVEEFGKIERGALGFRLDGVDVPAGEGYEILSLHGAEAAGLWNAPEGGEPHAAAGSPAVTIRQAGRGCAAYVGTYLSEQNAGAIFWLVLARTRLAPLAEAPEGVEVTSRRAADGRRLVFALNHAAEAKEVRGLPAGVDLLSEAPCTGRIELAPYGVAIIEGA